MITRPHSTQALDNELISASAGGSFERVIGGTRSEYLGSVVQASSGGFVFCGSISTSNPVGSDILVIKVGASGETIWTKTISNQRTSSGSIEATTDGGFIVAGSSSPESPSGFMPNSTSGLLIKLSSDGEVEWKRTYDLGAVTTISEAIETPDGYIASVTDFKLSNGFLLKVDKLGDEVWHHLVSEKAWLGEVNLTENDEYVISGDLINDPETNDDILLAKMSADGELLWADTLGDEHDNSARSLLVTNQGFLIGARDHVQGEGFKSFLQLVDFDRKETWKRYYKSEGIDLFNSLTLTRTAGSVVAVGSNDDSESKGMLLEVDLLDGTILWQRAFEEGRSNKLNEVRLLQGGGYIVAGTSTGVPDNRNGYLIKTDSQGN